MHWVPSVEQQPEQVEGSHTQAPEEHFCPTPQAAPVAPHTQVPLALQRSVLLVAQLTQAAPFAPQLVAVTGAWHTSP